MKNRSIGLLFALLSMVTVAITSSCKKKKVVENTATCTSVISYANDIVPLLTQNCTSCHNSSNHSGGYDLTTHSNVSNDAIIILNSMRHTNGADAMPENGAQLASTVIDKFDCWMQQGKPNN